MHDISVPVDHGRISVWFRPALPGKPTVLLIHGLTGTSRWWSPVISRLPEEVGVIAPDLRGRGQSWEHPGPYDLSSMAPDLSACLNHFEVPAATVAGYSMGAWLATVYGSTRHRRVKGIVLADGGLRVDFNPDLEPNAVLDEVLGASLERLGLNFESEESYLDFWRGHPALVGRWGSHLDTVFAYDVHQVKGGTYRTRVNDQSIIDGANDFLFDEQSIKAVYELIVPTQLLVVDHGTMDEPGGFMSDTATDEAVSRNPNVTVEKLRNLNHYTVMLGDGATHVASAIVRLL
ncbi:MAG TPA: alpha/beta hydrolase [Acidimicrobiia bacterium]